MSKSFADWEMARSKALADVIDMANSDTLLPTDDLSVPMTAADDFSHQSDRPPAEDVKVPVELKLDSDIVARFKEDGYGWQTRMNYALRRAAGLD